MKRNGNARPFPNAFANPPTSIVQTDLRQPRIETAKVIKKRPHLWLVSRQWPCVEAQDLHRTYRTHTGHAPPPRERDRGGPRRQLRDREGRALRPARPERRGQDDDDQDADHAAHPDVGERARARPRRRQGREGGAEADRLRLRRRARRLRTALRLRQPALLRRALRSAREDPEGADRGAARARRAQRPRARAGRGLLARDEAAPARRPRAAPRPGGALPRRADDRPRPGGRARAPRDDRLAHRRGQDDPADDPLHVRGRRPLRPDRGHLAGRRSSPRARPAS